MKESILVSVIMPVYNAATYIDEAIQSILGQSYRNFEFIIINDGSTDDSDKKINSYKDGRIILLNNTTNKGLIYSLNTGLGKAKGKYLVRMDADDISLPNRIEKQIAFMESNPSVGAAGSEYFSFTEKSSKKVFAYTNSEVLRTMLLFGPCLCHPSAIIRKEVLNSHSIGYNNNYLHAEDYQLWIEIGMVSKLSNVKEFLFKYRTHTNQVTLKNNSVQRNTASMIRRGYLQSFGFTYSNDDFNIHNSVALNELITSRDHLNKIETWFLKLIHQNGQVKAIEQKQFSFFLGKIWYDCCGNTNLGMSAYKRYFISPLCTYFPLSAKDKARLAAKCVIRSRKKQ